MNCYSCGKPIETNAKFCANCGAELDSPPQAPAMMSPPSGVPILTDKEYVVEQKIAAMRDTFGIKDRNGNLLAYVKKKIVSWGPNFWFETPDGTRFGEIHGKVVSVRPTFEIYDQQGLVGVVKKKVMKLFGSEWWLENNSGTEIARIKGNITEHDFKIKSPSGSDVAVIHKKWASIRDSYGIEITNEEITPYVIVAYAIAMDHAEWKPGKDISFGAAGMGVGGMMNDFGKT